MSGTQDSKDGTYTMQGTAPSGEGPPESGFSLFLSNRTKKIHFVRHAEGYHNVATKAAGTNECLLRGDAPARSHELWDARLTDKGIAQAQALRKHLATRSSNGRSFTSFDLVVVSPLTRTLETAYHIFGRPRAPGMPAFLDKGMAPEGSPELQNEATAKMPAPRMLVLEECRERFGHYVCDGRRRISEIMPEFPGFDFSLVEHDEDVFYSDEREPDSHCYERSLHFLEWLNRRPESCICVVTHSSFLKHLFAQFGSDIAADDKDDMQRLAGNCELRSVVLCSHGTKERAVHKRMRSKSEGGA